VCYFVSVGATAPTRLLAQVFDQQAELDVAAPQACAFIARAFPADDRVCLVTWRGCSCDLIAPNKRSTAALSNAAALQAAFQRSVLRLVRQLGSVRLLVHRHRQPCQLAVPGASLALTVEEFLGRERWFVEDVIMDIRERRLPTRAIASSAAEFVASCFRPSESVCEPETDAER
jgi:hypothetical protein